ncbi:MAG TPA: Zn-dependent hydrolase, partial [Rhodanobacteraceae bacterium]|nr:Zn-dependent hydrolase [Rhodanobacteraceae bacterium]
MRRLPALIVFAATAIGLGGCQHNAVEAPGATAAATASAATPASAGSTSAYVRAHLKDYVPVRLDADLSGFDASQKQMLARLVQAADVMNAIYWQQAWGSRESLMERIDDAPTRRFADINFGPWDRLNDNHPFVPGVGPRPPAARFYPANMSKAEFEAAPLEDKTSLYTLLRRNDAGALVTIPYHQAYRSDLEHAASLLQQASRLAENADFAKYLSMRAEALLSDQYRASDFAWMDMRGNP